MNLKDKKEDLIKELDIEKKEYRYKHIIKELINSSVIDELISKLDDVKTIPDTTCMPLTKKGYLTANEQFILLLENLIHRYSDDFYFLKFSPSFIINQMLEDNKYSEYLLCKNYLGNNDFIPYFNENYKNLICFNFISNIIFLSDFSPDIKEFIKSSKLDTYIKNKKIDKIHELLIHISLCNTDNFNLDCLFYNIVKIVKERYEKTKSHCKSIDSLYNFYIVIIESMIKNYYKKIDAAKIIFQL